MSVDPVAVLKRRLSVRSGMQAHHARYESVVGPRKVMHLNVLRVPKQDANLWKSDLEASGQMRAKIDAKAA
ncbi:MAG: hypothetical protein RBT81_06905 [Gammaproteobacteria bacterium]|jgi:hypothetical protein|nr:hypothetical protein [Gammaproteobacteria bacterium]